MFKKPPTHNQKKNNKKTQQIHPKTFAREQNTLQQFRRLKEGKSAWEGHYQNAVSATN